MLKKLCPLLLASTVISADVVANNTNTNADTHKTISFLARIRSETVIQNKQRAEALTIKLRATAQKNFFDHLTLLLQADHTSSHLTKKHSDGVIFNGRPAIIDPEGSEINQVFLSYDWHDYQLTLGRQLITHGNQRFVGDVGFRQNDQSYDGLRIQHHLTSGLHIDYALINQVNRIFVDKAGPQLASHDVRFNTLNGKRPLSQLGDHDVNGHLFHASFNDWEYIDVTAYGYIIDNNDVAAFSNKTFGVSAAYQQKIGSTTWLASLALAQQQQDAIKEDWMDYWQLEAGFAWKNLKVSLRQEHFGEKNGSAFITPLATLHKFQGWADQFVETPTQGLEDRSLRLVWQKRPLTIDLRYHDFHSDTSNTNIGEEFDVDISYTVDRQHAFTFRYADFNASSGQSIAIQDINKLFFMYSYTF